MTLTSRSRSNACARWEAIDAIEAAALDIAMRRGTLPTGSGSKFFLPTERFLEWAVGAACGRVVYDVGAGAGHVAAALAARGLSVRAIDVAPCPPGVSEYRVEPADAGVHPYAPGSVVMLCRPCHGNFPARAAEQALRCGASVWYVGLQRNVGGDLPRLRDFKCVLGGAGEAGEAGECVWTMEAEMKESDAEKINIALVDRGGGPEWCMDDARVEMWRTVNRSWSRQVESDVVTERREGVTRREWYAIQEQRESAELAVELASIRERVLAQCGGEMIALRADDGSVVAEVPRAPFVCWVLNRTTLAHLMPRWEPVSRSGMKLQGDCRFHSDWWFGAGFGTDGGAYDRCSPLHEAAMNARSEIQHELGGFQCAVLSGGEDVYGTVGHDIAVVPDLRPERLDEILRCKAVITEAGGVGAHLAQVGRERSLPIVRVKGAVATFKKGMSLCVLAGEGRVEVNVVDADVQREMNFQDGIDFDDDGA